MVILSSYELYKLGVFKALSGGVKSVLFCTPSEPAGTYGETQSLIDTAERFRTRDDPKKVLMLMSHTGGGHRMSSEALSTALNNLYGSAIWLR